MTDSRTAVITVAHGRHRHLELQTTAWRRSTVTPDVRCVVALDDAGVATAAGPDCDTVEFNARDARGLPIAAARNAGADRALQHGAELLVFLDVDCLPGDSMLARYQAAYASVGAGVLLGGPVTYLPPPASSGYRLDALPALTRPHPARPDPAPGTLVAATDYDLFWSLSFAIAADTWRRLGGFCVDYVGYGGEDTDFAAVAQSAGIGFSWVGGAHAYHQHHPVSDPPVEHLEAIVRNASIFRRRWGRWPMTGWLDEFERLGLITRAGDEIRLIGTVSAPA
jgi:GT2 family glycosyltransferase